MEKYIKEIIVNGYCKSILPATMVDGKIEYYKQDVISVNCDMGVVESLEFLKGVIEIIDDLEDHLIFEGEYAMSIDSFYYSPSKARIYIAYEEGEENLLNLISTIKPNDYLIDIECEIRKKNPSRTILLQIIERKIEEAYQCEI